MARWAAASQVRYHFASRATPLKRGSVRRLNTMPEHLPELDWKRWQQLAPTLLNRYCDGVLANAAGFSTRNASGHEKFLALYQFIGESNRDVAVVFDNRRRSSALLQLAAAVARGIMSEEELNSFSEETQSRIRRIVGDGG